MSKLQPLALAIDFNNHAGGFSGPLFVEKIALHPVRLAIPGEITLRGETTVEGQVAILDTKKPDEKPIYCMSLEAFLRNSVPEQKGLKEPTSDSSLWFVERPSRRAFIVPEDHGPFHLDAPSTWNGHKGWDVAYVTTLLKSDGREIKGYLVLETSHGPMFDKAATEANLYRVCQP